MNPEQGDNGEQQVMVVGPDGRPVGMARVPQAEDGDEEQGVGSMVEQPAKVMRIGTMIKQLLEEVRAAPLDEACRGPAARRSTRTPSRSWRTGSRPSCARSCSACRCRSPRTSIPSEAELRIAQAQLVGWLEGLFHGIQTALFAQQMAARAQLEQMRRGLPPGAGGQQPDGGLGRGTGQYL